MVATKKDSRQWSFDEKEELPLEWINGIFSYIETGETILKTSLPHDYQNGKFPDHNNKILCKRSKIGLEGNFTNNQNNLILNTGGNIKLWIYPNIAPFKCFNNISIKANNGVQLRLIVRSFTGNIIYNQAITVINNKTTFDLSDVEVGQLKDLKYCSMEILSNTNNTIIENIDIFYDLRDEKLTEIFQNHVKIADFTASKILTKIKTVDGITSGLDAEYLGGQKYNLYASKIQTLTKKFSELVNGDYIVGFNLSTTELGRWFYLGLTNGNWVNIDSDGNLTQSPNFEGVFDISLADSSSHLENLDDWFTFEVRINKDLIDVQNELLSKIGDNLIIEKYNNGFRIKKEGAYIYSACWGSVDITTTGSNGTASTNINYPFTFSGLRTSFASASTSSALQVAGSTQSTGVSSMRVTLQRSSAGTSPVRWLVIGD